MIATKYLNMEEENTDELSENNKDFVKASEKMFTLKKWNAVAMWSWDVECDTCAICRVQVMGMRLLYFFKYSPIILHYMVFNVDFYF